MNINRLAIALLLVLTLTAAAQDRPRLVVHEWGTFTSVSGSSGVALEWRPLAGPSDLPSFVYDATRPRPTTGPSDYDPRQRKKRMVCTVRMETPVLYFYADKETRVSVKVDFPKGKITEWYPAAREAGSTIDWGTISVLPGAAPELPTEKGESHYYPARETDAAPVRVGTQHEKFLFYRGAGTFDLPLKAGLDKGQVRVDNATKHRWSRLFLVNVKNGRLAYTVREPGSHKADEIWLTPIPSKESSVQALAADVVKTLTEEGLYRREAEAMVKTWRDTWFADKGMRVFYVVPRRITDELLPLTVSPAPTECVRVLVGRAEIITPEMEKGVLADVERLGSDSFDEREDAMKSLRRIARFIEPILKRALETATDAEVKARLKTLLGG